MTTSPAILEQAALSVAAHLRIKRWLAPTPCIETRQSFDGDTRLFYKAENFQKTGSFKIRGAPAKLTTMPTGIPAITASSGNHGLALATAAQMTGHDVTVVLPQNVSREKLSRIKGLGVQTLLHSNDAGLAEQHAQVLAKEQGKIYVPPYNDPQVRAPSRLKCLNSFRILMSSIFQLVVVGWFREWGRFSKHFHQGHVLSV